MSESPIEVDIRLVLGPDRLVWVSTADGWIPGVFLNSCKCWLREPVASHVRLEDGGYVCVPNSSLGPRDRAKNGDDRPTTEVRVPVENENDALAAALVCDALVLLRVNHPDIKDSRDWQDKRVAFLRRAGFREEADRMEAEEKAVRACIDDMKALPK